ncbi:MAG: carotenoid 1,2-hydratase [Desulfobacterales bacterium]|nr:carotenoid 1,2-hydratase [Desulfobacterales bacterium]
MTLRIFTIALLFWFYGVALAAGPDVAEILSRDGDACYEKARPGVPITLSSAMKAHERFRTEWWYVTGNVADKEGRRYGYQFTLFRRGLTCGGTEDGSSWDARHLYFAHIAVSQEEGRRFHSEYRMERQSFDLAGWRGEGEGLSVWVNDVDLSWNGKNMRLASTHGSPAFSLTLTPIKPPVLQGEKGYSIKDPKSGSASHYLSLPRLKTRGILRLEGKEVVVKGLSWMDREWSTGSLGAGQAGWDWMALNLDDGQDLMVCRVRARKAENHVYFGSLSRADGSVKILTPEEIEMKSFGSFKGPSGARYPLRWTLSIASEELDLEVTPLFNEQEHTQDVVYWEGAVVAKGKSLGRGYLEMTGY